MDPFSLISSAKLAGILGGLIAILGAIFGVFRAGQKAERSKQLKREIRGRDEQLEMHREDDEIARRTHGMTDDEARRKAKEWARR